MPETNEPKSWLDKEICFPMYACTKEIIKLYTPYLDKIGLTYTQYITMMVLWEKKQARVKDLGEILYLNSATLTPVLKKLESKGLITRNRMKSDERNVLVQVTPDGENLERKAASISRSVMKKLDLEENESKVLYILSRKILEKLSEKNGLLD
ncbi:MAG: MarR family transcriptional regulator [Treponema sp.]|nr:MarR family transcriptional regulator [Treponema sp.]